MLTLLLFSLHCISFLLAPLLLQRFFWGKFTLRHAIFSNASTDHHFSRRMILKPFYQKPSPFSKLIPEFLNYFTHQDIIRNIEKLNTNSVMASTTTAKKNGDNRSLVYPNFNFKLLWQIIIYFFFFTLHPHTDTRLFQPNILVLHSSSSSTATLSFVHFHKMSPGQQNTDNFFSLSRIQFLQLLQGNHNINCSIPMHKTKLHFNNSHYSTFFLNTHQHIHTMCFIHVFIPVFL